VIALSPTFRVSAALAIGCVLVVVGAFMVGGLGWALIATGVLLAGLSLVITYDDEQKPPPGNEETSL